MARVKGIMQVTGGLKGVSMYTLRGSEEVIMRTKGGPSKYTIKTRESCKPLRDNGKEWGGCSKAASGIRRGLEPLVRLADINVSGALNGLCKKIQCNDLINEKGSRHVLVSENRKLLTDFDYNKTNPFNNVIRLNPIWEIDRNAVSATITIPAFDPLQHLIAPNKLPFMRFVMVLGITTDEVMDENGGDYIRANRWVFGAQKELLTEWNPVKRSLPEKTFNIEILNASKELTNNDTVLLGIGVEFGTVGADGEGEAVKYAGCAKILGAV